MAFTFRHKTSGFGNDSSVPADSLPSDSISSVALADALLGSGSLMAAGSWDSTVRIWNVNTVAPTGFGVQQKTVAAVAAGMHNTGRPVLCCAFRPVDNAVLYGGLDNTVKVWQPGLAEAKDVAVHTAPVKVVKWCDHHGGLVVRSVAGALLLSGHARAEGPAGASVSGRRLAGRSHHSPAPFVPVRAPLCAAGRGMAPYGSPTAARHRPPTRPRASSKSAAR